ncbi:MAG: DEAD/DEAH box helicase, partial [Alphaproteobacteria bacterium]|nr:DEAD/DEAH box helicase [Alphaproteobacteria bacterium]
MKSNPTMIPGCPEGQDARVLAERARASMAEDRVLVHVALDDARVAVLTELLAFFAPDVAVICFPAWDCLPYDRVSPNPEIVAARVSALTQLIVWEGEKRRYPRVLLTTVNAITQKVTPKGPLSASSFTAEAGRRLDPAALQSYLSRNGYSRTDTVREHGEYAVRGGIIDVYPSGYLNPIRIDLFGDEIEAIKEFDPVTQRTGRSLEHFSLTQAMEFTLDDESIARFRSGYRDLFGVPRSEDPLYAAVSEGRRYNGMDHWLPLFFDSMDTLLDYTPGAAITMDHDVPQACSERAAQVADFYQARKTLAAAGTDRKKSKDVSLSGSVYHPLPVVHLYVVEENWMDGAAVLSPFVALEEELTVSGARKGRDFGDIRALPGGDVFGAVKEYVGVRQGAGCQILIAAYSEGSKERLKGLLDHAGIENLKDCGFYEDVKKLKSGQIGITVLALERGFVAPDLTVMTEQDILGDRLARKAQKRKKADNFLTEVSSLAPGDLVVHMEHGVGRFEGLETLAVGKMLHDCLKIVYAGEDKLFVPVENIEVLSRFGSDEGAVPLDKLGGAGWQARKAKVKKDLMRIADHLLKIAAARTLRDGEKLPVNDNYEDFAAHFPYDETEDQQRAIAAVLEDLDKGHPMDRLVCGDVGFGKTEVALRAAYVAAMNGVQVAVVVPTTLLARQHFKNFFSRFQGTGLRVEQLSRMVAPRDADKVRQGLKDGSINIVVGTHALFAKGMGFANLGLLIVDEEQRFGVKQKERLKELKENVHVLTLTATPIPRTLQMSLTGVKEMSLIATPPVDRLAVRTFVLPFDPMVVREALMRERHRGGQSFYVCPRVKDLGDVEERLKALVPELKIVTAHGQLPSTDLEDRMTAFYDGQYDILLATNIIESGIDIPTANTMIVHRAEMFGLAQLYQ